MAKSNEIKPTDGRQYNKRKKGQLDVVKPTTAAINKAKKERMKEFGVKAIKKVFGSEQDFWMNLAEEAKKNHNDRKLLLEYVYGKPKDGFGNNTQRAVNPVINFYGHQAPATDNTIDVPPEDEE